MSHEYLPSRAIPTSPPPSQPPPLQTLSLTFFFQTNAADRNLRLARSPHSPKYWPEKFCEKCISFFSCDSSKLRQSRSSNFFPPPVSQAPLPLRVCFLRLAEIPRSFPSARLLQQSHVP